MRGRERRRSSERVRVWGVNSSAVSFIFVLIADYYIHIYICMHKSVCRCV